MIAGIRKRMRNSGEVVSAEARVVYQNDIFHYQLGEDPQIIHEPPPLDKDPGAPIGAYAIIKLTNGETLREVMRYSEIERVRAFSKTGDRDGSPWKTSWPEMARKTVLRRCAKAAPTNSEIERMLARDDEEPEVSTDPRYATPIPPRPTRDQFVENTSATLANGPDDTSTTGSEQTEQEQGEAGSATDSTDTASEPEVAGLVPVIDGDGEIIEITDAAQAEQALLGVFVEALRRSMAAKPGTAAHRPWKRRSRTTSRRSRSCPRRLRPGCEPARRKPSGKSSRYHLLRRPSHAGDPVRLPRKPQRRRVPRIWGVAEKKPPQQQQTTQGEQAATSEQQAAMQAEHSDAAERIVTVPFDAKNTRTWFAPARLELTICASGVRSRPNSRHSGLSTNRRSRRSMINTAAGTRSWTGSSPEVRREPEFARRGTPRYFPRSLRAERHIPPPL